MVVIKINRRELIMKIFLKLEILIVLTIVTLSKCEEVDEYYKFDIVPENNIWNHEFFIADMDGNIKPE